MVEDSAADVLMTEEALSVSKLANRLHVVEDGVEAVQFLRRQGRHGQAPRPDLILLDLNLPRMNGHEVLAQIKGDASLMRIPVVVLTTSRSDDDVLKSYELHANCFITKPMDFSGFSYVVGSVEQFWFSVATLPPE
jgi:CheY-like chemotaxis protein